MRQSPSSSQGEKLKEGQSGMERDKGEKQSCVCGVNELEFVLLCSVLMTKEHEWVERSQYL